MLFLGGKIMEILEAKYEIITPMFMSGSDTAIAELRAPSFKGVLRYWYRAIMLAELQALAKVKQSEQKLFGSTDTGQAKFLLRLSTGKNIKVEKKGKTWRDQGSAYLGYGVINWDKKSKSIKTSREYIKPGGHFTVTLYLKPNIDDDEKVNLQKALKAVSLFGGLGARSRRGFGSVNLVSLKYNDIEQWKQPNNVEELKEQMQECLNIEKIKELKELLPYSAFSNHSKVIICRLDASNNNPFKLLDEVGKEMIRFRSYGRKKKNREYTLVFNEKAEQNFKDDHDLVWQAVSGKQIDKHPRRVIFGLPHNYRFSNNAVVSIQPQNYERRGSPLYIRIHKVQSEYVVVFIVLPAEFLPEGERIKIKVKNGTKDPVPLATNDFSVLHQFLNRRKFNSRLEVL